MNKIKVSVVVMCLASLCMCSYNAFAESYDNNSKVSFSSVVLPDVCENTTLAQTKSGGKTTGRSYGKAKISSYKNCTQVDFWMRSKVNGSWHYWTPFVVSNVSDKKEHKVKYCDAKKSYYQKGVTAELRGENADSRIAIFGDSEVSGVAWFN